MTESKPALYFIGLGNMGNPMVANLLKAGYCVTVFDVEKAKAENLLAAGAKWAQNLADGLANCDVVLTSLPGPDQVTQVYLGDQGLLAQAKPGTAFIDTTTSSVELAVQIAEVAIQRDLHFLEAPTPTQSTALRAVS